MRVPVSEDTLEGFDIPEEAISIRCRKCNEFHPTKYWRYYPVRCEDCGHHDGMECPYCGETYDSVYEKGLEYELPENYEAIQKAKEFRAMIYISNFKHVKKNRKDFEGIRLISIARQDPTDFEPDEVIKALAPSSELLGWAVRNKRKHGTVGKRAAWSEYAERFLSEMRDPRSIRAKHALAERILSGERIALLCHCSDSDQKEEHCHCHLVAGIVMDCINPPLAESEKWRSGSR